MTVDVFISYPSQAKESISQLVDALSSRGITIWYADKELKPSDNATTAVRQALKNSRAVIFIVVPGLKPSYWMQEEHIAALESYWEGGKKVLVPIVVGKAEVPNFLKGFQTLRIAHKSDWKRAAHQVAAWLKSPNRPLPKPTKEARAVRNDRLEDLERICEELKIDETIMQYARKLGIKIDVEEVKSQLNPRWVDLVDRIEKNEKTSKAKE